MAVVFGVTGSAGGLVLTDFTEGTNAEIAEARDSTGAVTDMHAYSQGKTITATGYVTSGGTVPAAGTTISAGGGTYLVESAELVESNTDFQKMNLSLKSADSATLTGISTSSGQ